MSDSETRAIRRAAILLLGVSVARWGWAASRPEVSIVGRNALDEVLEESRNLVEERRVRERPLQEGERLDPNRATAAELDRLPGVGPSTADAIVRSREARGRFVRPEEMLEVRGIGPATLDRIRPHLDLSEPPGLTAPASRSVRAPDGRVDVNHADIEALQSLPGVGPALSRRIVEARREAPFRSAEELARVRGIGPATVERIRHRIVIRP
jgi:competence ComEA-like helix-hairpin-helix protein